MEQTTHDELVKKTAQLEALTIEVENLTNLNTEQPMTAAIIKSDKTRQYSLAKFILGLSDPQSKSNAGYEFEISQETAIKSGRSSDTPMIPFFALKGQNTTTAANTDGNDLGSSLATPIMADGLFTTALGASFNNAIAPKLGIQTVQAPRTNVLKVPRLTSPLIPSWVARDTALSDSDALFDTIEATPKTVGLIATILRSALLDTSPAMEQIIANEILRSVSSAMDDSILGALTPSANAPKGIYNELSGSVNDLGSLTTVAEVLAMLRANQMINDSKEVKILGGYGFNLWASQQSISPTLAQVPLMSETGQLRGNFADLILSSKMDAFQTVDEDEAAVIPFICGDWSYITQVLFGQGLEVSVNPFAQDVYKKGGILMRGILDLDVVIRDPLRFSLASVTL